MSEKIKLVGHVGLGSAGGPLAENIIAMGSKLYSKVHMPRSNAHLLKCIEANGFPVKEAAARPDGFSGVDLAITIVPNGHNVRDILLRSQGLASYLKLDPREARFPKSRTSAHAKILFVFLGSRRR